MDGETQSNASLPNSENSDDWETDNSEGSDSVQNIENQEAQTRNSSPEIIELSTDSDDYLTANSVINDDTDSNGTHNLLNRLNFINEINLARRNNQLELHIQSLQTQLTLQSEINHSIYSKIPNFEEHLPILHKFSAVLIPGQKLKLTLSRIDEREAFQISISDKLKLRDHLLIVPRVKLNSEEEGKFNPEISSLDSRFAVLVKIVDYDNDVVKLDGSSGTGGGDVIPNDGIPRLTKTVFSVNLLAVKIVKIQDYTRANGSQNPNFSLPTKLDFGRIDTALDFENIAKKSIFHRRFQKLAKQVVNLMKKCLLIEGDGTSKLEKYRFIKFKTTCNDIKSCLSFVNHVLEKLPLSDLEKLYILTNSDYCEKLRLCYNFLQKISQNIGYYCSQCPRKREKLFETKDIVKIPGVGSAMGCYVNPHGVVHDTVTVGSCFVSGVQEEFMRPCLQDSWFSGFGWVILYCDYCNDHLGWKFVKLVDGTLGPDSFYGFSRGSISMDRVGVVGELAGVKDRVVNLSENDVQILLMPKSKVLSYQNEIENEGGESSDSDAESENDGLPNWLRVIIDDGNTWNGENPQTSDSGSTDNREIEEVD